MIPALVAAFLLVPIVEIAVIVKVGSVIGPWWTILLLLAESAIGAWIVRREGFRTWRALRDNLRGGGLPSRELTDGALVLIGGALLLTPGFVTDIAGFLFVLPVTRPLVRRTVFTLLAGRYRALGLAAGAARFAAAGRARGAQHRDGSHRMDPDHLGQEAGYRAGARVVRGEVVDDHPAPPHG